MSITLDILEISKSFPGVVALANVSLSLRAGTVHALVGENGAGKSTLINILSGNLQPDAGELLLDGEPLPLVDAHDAHRRGIFTVHQELDMFGDLTVMENIGLEQGLPTNRLGLLDRAEMRRRANSALAMMHADISPDFLAVRLAPAQRQLIHIGSALSQSVRVLILDEPTSSLSASESETLFARIRQLREEGVAILYVSHRFEELFALADEMTVLRDGEVVWHGPRDETNPDHLLQQMVGREVDTTAFEHDRQAGTVLLECQGLTAQDGTFVDVSLQAKAGEVLGVYGLVGAGRSEWAQSLVGLRAIRSGRIVFESDEVQPTGPGPMAKRGLVYVPEDRLRQGLVRGLSVRVNHVLASLRRWSSRVWLTRAPEAERTRLARDRLGIRMRNVEQRVGNLSGGNQQKVVLGRWLECEPRVMLLDEPTRGIDVGAKSEIHRLIQQLADEGRAIVMISSELPEVLAQSDRIAVFCEGRLARVFDANTTSAEEVAAAAMPDVVPKEEVVLTPERRWSFPVEAGLALVIVALFAILEWQTGRFLTVDNLLDLFKETALLSFCALAAAVVILAGGIDISLGSIMVLSAAVAGGMWMDGTSLPIVLTVAIGIGGVCGLVNALLTLVGRVHPIVITLATLSLYRGLAVWWLNESDILIGSASRSSFLAKWGGVSVFLWLALAVAVSLYLFLRQTVWGREVFAVGSNPDAAWRVGISRGRVWILVFTIQGMLLGLAALLYLAQSGNLQQIGHENRTLEAIAAAVLGGVAITGGRGSVLGVILGCLFLISLGPTCQFLGIPTIWRQTLVGVVTVLAVTLDSLWRRRRT